MSTQCLQEVSHSHSVLVPHAVQSSRLVRVFKEILNNVQISYERRRQQKISRDALGQLNELDDNTLRDIGLTQGDVEWAHQLPLSVNASKELGKIAEERRRRLYW